MNRIEQVTEKLASWFFGFWVSKRRISFLVMLLIVLIWSVSVLLIPKESTPNINFWRIIITTVSVWSNPIDVDSLITEKIEKEIDWVKWIKKVESTSSLWVSTMLLTLDEDYDTATVINEVKNKVDTVTLPEWATRPKVIELATEVDKMFQVQLFASWSVYNQQKLKDLALYLKDRLEWSNWIAKIDVQWWDDVEYRLLLDQQSMQSLWLTISQIVWTLRAYNRNQPLWNVTIGDLQYDFRISGSFWSPKEILDIPLNVAGWPAVRIWQIGRIEEYDPDTSLKTTWKYKQSWLVWVTLSVNKKSELWIFAAAWQAKEAIEKMMRTEKFRWVGYEYTFDLSKNISDDYDNLSWNGFQTIVLVFLCVLLFIGRREATIATIIIPLWFFITFTVLFWMGRTLNFMTNFSLILTLWMAIDITIVIIESAYEKVNQWFNPTTAVLMSVRDMAAPLIASTATNVVVFAPLMTLPDITWKFLAYVPITAFITLIAWLFLTLTLNSALISKFIKPKKIDWNEVYVRDEEWETLMSHDDRTLLEHDRQWKQQIEQTKQSWFQAKMSQLAIRYSEYIQTFLDESTEELTKKSRKRRHRLYLIVLFWTIATFFLFPLIWFQFFPWWDQWVYSIEVTAKPWTSTETMAKLVPSIEKVVSNLPEVDQYTVTTKLNVSTIAIQLLDKEDRSDKWLRTVFDVEKQTLKDLQFLVQKWYRVETKVQEWWPPQAKPVWIDLIAQSPEQFSQLVDTAKKFQTYIRSMPWTKNVTVSSNDTPWQFVYEFDKDTLWLLWITPNDVLTELFGAINGLSAGTISVNWNDATIKVLYDSLTWKVTAWDIESVSIATRWWAVQLWQLASSRIDNSVASIKREDWQVTIKVEWDLDNALKSKGQEYQSQLNAYAATYKFPTWIRSVSWWEAANNSEILVAVWTSFIIAMFVIFWIAVLLFDSYRQPALVLVAVFLSLFGINIWLAALSIPYSLPFMIWFVSMAWIVVNFSIILIDRINENTKNGVEIKKSIIEASRSRLQPIILTTLINAVWILPTALQDEFWMWLGLTIVFGLMSSSVLTLLVLPPLFYSSTKMKRRHFLWFLPPYWIYRIAMKIRWNRSRIV